MAARYPGAGNQPDSGSINISNISFDEDSRQAPRYPRQVEDSGPINISGISFDTTDEEPRQTNSPGSSQRRDFSRSANAPLMNFNTSERPPEGQYQGAGQHQVSGSANISGSRHGTNNEEPQQVMSPPGSFPIQDLSRSPNAYLRNTEARYPGGQSQGEGQQQDSGSIDVSGLSFDSDVQESKQAQSQPGPSQKRDLSQPGPSQSPNSAGSPLLMDRLELLNSNNLDHLKLWIRVHYDMVEGYIFYRDEIEYIISQYMPNFRPGVIDSPSVLMQILKKILPVKERINISPNLKHLLEGSNLAASVEKHKSRIMDNVGDMSNQVEHLLHETQKNNLYISELEAKLAAALSIIRILEQEVQFGPVGYEPKFLHEMQRDLKKRENLESSLMGEVQRNQNVIDRLNREVMRLKADIVHIEHERLKELAEIAQDLEIDENLKKAIVRKITCLNASAEECDTAINEWLSAIHESLSINRGNIEKARTEVKKLDTEVARQEAEVQDLSWKRNEMNAEIAALRETIAEEEMECSNLELYISQIEQEKQNLTSEAEQINQELDNIITSTPSRYSRFLNSPPIPYIDDTGSSNVVDIIESPEQFRAGDSPGHWSKHLDDTASLSLDSSRGAEIPNITVSPPSPIDLDACQRNIYIPNPIGPGTQTISQPIGGLFPSTAKVNASTQTVNNLIDIGKSLNMQTSHSGLSSPYHQDTRVVSNVPLAGPSRLIDNPFTIRHTAELTPSRFVTPFISTTRFGYTDPRAKVLNLPPGDNYDLDTVLKKRLLLTSPQREDPLLVDIGVNPRPLVQTASGEHFVCDISLDVKETGKKKSYISPVFTRGVPPAVTPTVTRREGLFTPKGIFKKRHYNIRRIIEPDYDSPGKYFTFDSRSPPPTFPPRLNLSDRTISWEKVPGLNDTYEELMMNRTFDTSDSPLLNQTFDSPPPALNRTHSESPSPLIKGPSYKWRMQNSFTSSEASPSPVHGRTFDSNLSPGVDGNFDRSQSSFHGSISSRIPSPMSDRSFGTASSPRDLNLNRTFERSISPRLGGTYDRSMSPRLNVTFDRSSSPRSGGASDRSMSPRLDRIFDRSISPGSGGTYDSSMSPRLDRTFDRSMSPRSGGTYDRSMSPRLDGTFDRSMSPGSGGTYDRSMSPRLDGTFNRSMSPRSGGTYDRSMSSRLDGTFDRSMSPRSGGTYDRSMSPRSGGTYDRSMSPRSGGTYDRSMSPRLHQTFDSSMSPRSGGTYDRSMSPRSGGTYDRSMSPRSDGTYDRSTSSRLDDSFNRGRSPSPSPRLDNTFSPSILNRAFYPDPDDSIQSEYSRERMSPRSGGTYDRSLSSRLDGTFNLSRSPSPSPRLDNTFSPSVLNRAFCPNPDDSIQSDDSRRSASLRYDTFGNFPRVNRTGNVSVSPRLNRTYDVSYPHLMDRPFIESPQLNRTFDSPQRFNIPGNESDRSSLNRTFETYSSRNNALSDEEWSFDSGYSSYASNQSGQSERSP